MGKEASGAGDERLVQRRVLIVHRSPLFRDIMEQLLKATRSIDIVGVTTDVETGLSMAQECRVDTVILEAAEGDEQAVTFVTRATQENQELRTIALSLSNTGYSVYSAKSLRNIEPEELLELVLSRPGEEP